MNRPHRDELRLKFKPVHNTIGLKFEPVFRGNAVTVAHKLIDVRDRAQVRVKQTYNNIIGHCLRAVGQHCVSKLTTPHDSCASPRGAHSVDKMKTQPVINILTRIFMSKKKKKSTNNTHSY